MHEIWIAHDTWILVGDGRKALMLRNDGTPQNPSLNVIDVLKDDENPPTAKQGTERPGRVVQSNSNRRSAVEQTDWHDKAEQDFLKTLAGHLDKALEKGEVKSLIIVAAPRALGMIRPYYSNALKEAIRDEISKDMVNMPVYEIEKQLTGAS